ncbi:fructose/tagatose bisphosphate aldolase [Allocatelliglobosispora scoriae]|uniref:Fructose/tagatose bisphosphate aldolase n=1 Tax=Allocatelliglobosispora scoriae TaxID=643052 RepID=A0A841BKM2_9ACTN|nr:class II fructose-bisphosphate aldolase [Allocatelliglobosispora scoriae]MBB5867360.1 fructose/tagatose bisphosphate aldolase [Allocatelliglobosispora scoriae]
MAATTVDEDSDAVQRESGTRHPLYLAFHGGSGSTDQAIKAAIRYGVVKFNG